MNLFENNGRDYSDDGRYVSSEFSRLIRSEVEKILVTGANPRELHYIYSAELDNEILRWLAMDRKQKVNNKETSQ